MQKTLDLSIKKHEIGATVGGYCVNGKQFDSYMDKQIWMDFIAGMKENHYEAFIEFGEGSGSELREKGTYPPKMASYGSSSRMIYNLCKNIDGFHFERKLPTTVGGIANIDGFMENNDKYVFVEAKCREPYGAKSHMVDIKYKELFQYIDKENSCNLNIQVTDAGSNIDARFIAEGVTIDCFDIKQMICHLLGISGMFLNNPTDRKICFAYLCYNPKLIDIVDERKKIKIFAEYNKMRDECLAIDFKELFGITLRYLRNELNIGNASDKQVAEMASNFEFYLCDQSNYSSYIN